MKKFFLIIMLILCLSGCSNEYEGWKEIELPEIGSIKIPQEWICHIKDNRVYLTDKDIEEPTEQNTYLVGIFERKGEYDRRIFDKEWESGELITSQVFSNDTIVGRKEFFLMGKRAKNTI